MKRFVLSFLAAIMILAGVACAGDENPDGYWFCGPGVTVWVER